MATTTFREDYLGRDLVAPTVNSLDSLGRVTTSTADFIGRPLRRVVRANTTAASPPTAPAVGATVADGTATLLRQK